MRDETAVDGIAAGTYDAAVIQRAEALGYVDMCGPRAAALRELVVHLGESESHAAKARRIASILEKDAKDVPR
ncbi:MAG: hypothetical protein ACYDCK_01575 [Thermoplasmatota archaeon]